MRLPICWLKDFVECHYSTKEIADIFTAIGFECEEILNVEGEEVLDLSTPSNRALGFFYAADIEEGTITVTE